MKKPQYRVLVRNYTHGRFVDLWLIRRVGACDASMLWGQLIPQAAEEVIEALGLPVDREGAAYDAVPLPVKDCLSVPKQESLFAEKP